MPRQKLRDQLVDEGIVDGLPGDQGPVVQRTDQRIDRGPEIQPGREPARAVQSARRQLVAERGWPRRNVLTKPFWTPGKKGME